MQVRGSRVTHAAPSACTASAGCSLSQGQCSTGKRREALWRARLDHIAQLRLPVGPGAGPLDLPGPPSKARGPLHSTSGLQCQFLWAALAVYATAMG